MPNAFSDVNFIPDEVVSNRKRVSQIKGLNKFAVTFMILSLVVGFGLLGYNLYIKNKITRLEAEIVVEENEIKELNEFAESGYKLGLRLDSIQQILSTRPYYAKVIEQIYEEVPRGVTIADIQVSETGAVILSGSASPNYIPISTLQENLESSDTGYFTEIRLRSASLDKTSGAITFTIDLLLDLEKTYESI